MSNKHTCPSCGFLVFDDPPGSYDICPLCGWEDDHVQLRYPVMIGGANGGSLHEYQQIALKDYPSTITTTDGFMRDPEWRPLNTSELVASPNQPQSGIQYFESAVEDSPQYYWKKNIENAT